MAKRIDYAAAHQHYMAVMAAELPARGCGKVATRLKRDGVLAKVASRRSYRAFLDAGGTAGDWEAFKQWIKGNWQTILQILLTLFL